MVVLIMKSIYRELTIMRQVIKQAFTLIELLVVIAIIGILSGLIVVSMGGMSDKANVAKLQVFSNSLKNSLMLNLVSEWKFDQINYPSTDQTPDLWNGGNTGTLKENGYAGACDLTHCPQVQTTGCVSGNCLRFDGTNDYVDFGIKSSLSFADQQEWSVGYWVNSEKETWQALSGANPETTQFLLLHSNGSICYCSSVWVFNCSGTITRLNKWQYIVISSSGPSRFISFYVDGVYRGGTTPASSAATFKHLGKAGDPRYYLGLMDEVRLFNKVVSLSQIKEQYYTGLNSLLANNSINEKEYISRINSIAANE